MAVTRVSLAERVFALVGLEPVLGVERCVDIRVARRVPCEPAALEDCASTFPSVPSKCSIVGATSSTVEPWSITSRPNAFDAICSELRNDRGAYSRSVARLLMDQGRLEEAGAALEEADAASAGPSVSVRFILALLHDRYDEAEAMIPTPSEVEPLPLHWSSWHQRALVALHRGKSAEALEHLDRSIGVFGKPDRLGGYSHNVASRIYLETGRTTEAFDRAELAQTVGSGNPPEWEGLFLASLAKAHLGNLEEARVIADKLQERTRPIPSDKERRRHLHLLGSLNLLEGNHEAAVRSLEEARSMLFPHAGTSPFVTSAEGRVGPAQHVPILYALASAYLETGDKEKALEIFQRIVDTRIERLTYPIDYVRSLYFLGRLHESTGDKERAKEYYERFVDHWGDGDLDRERVEEARARLRSIK